MEKNDAVYKSLTRFVETSVLAVKGKKQTRREKRKVRLGLGVELVKSRNDSKECEKIYK